MLKSYRKGVLDGDNGRGEVSEDFDTTDDVTVPIEDNDFTSEPAITDLSKGYWFKFGDTDTGEVTEYVRVWIEPFYLEKSDYPSKSDSFCSVSFIVSGLGDISVEFYAYQLMNSKLADVPYTVTPGKSLTDTVKTPEKPVIKTESLPDGILNMQYDFMVEADRDDFLSWEVTSGALPEGIALSDEGMLSGIPTESGSFTFGVRAALTAGNIVSDEKQFTLTVLEAPKKLTPTKSSSYTVSGGYVTKVVAETKLSDFVGNFETPEYVKVFGSDGKEITDKNAYVGTGCRVSLMNGDNAVDSADVVVLGDISGDGRLTSVDYLRLRAYFGGDYELSGAYLAAAHIAGRDTVTSVDYLRLRAHFSGDYNIYN